MKKFNNTAEKINVIRNVFRQGEKLNGREIANRIKRLGYRVEEGNLKMFIYYNMLYKHLNKEYVNGTNRYYLLGY